MIVIPEELFSFKNRMSIQFTRGIRFEVAQDVLGRLMQDSNNLGQIFQILGSENHDFGYLKLIALGGDGRYWYYPNKGKKRNAWWEYLGTEIPADTEFYYTQGERRGNTDYAYVRDHLGSLVGLVNSGGTLSDQTEYDAYGAARSGSTSARMGYAGMYKLGDQYLTRFRVYDTQTARWISRDPIAEAGGINLYGYVGGNPIMRIDSTGLLCVCAYTEALDANARGSSQGQCAKYVRTALEAGGADTRTRPVSAKDYGGLLERNGFVEVPPAGYTPQAGDTAVFNSYAGGSVHGHVQGYTGNGASGWVSDFKQPRFWANRGYEGANSFKVYRPTDTGSTIGGGCSCN